MGIDIYGTHFPVLAATVARTNGPVLELGMGDFSTPLLHLMCKNRFLLSMESDRTWADKFMQFTTENHHISCTNEWEKWLTQMSPNVFWSVVLVDCAPGEERHKLALRLKDKAQFIICHDSEKDYGAGGNYMYEKIVPEFKHVSEYRYLRPYTLILSNFEKFEIDPVEGLWVPPKA